MDDILDSTASGVIENFSSDKVRFFFQTFVWGSDALANTNIQVKCSVKVCNPDVTTCTNVSDNADITINSSLYKPIYSNENNTTSTIIDNKGVLKFS